MMIERTIEGKVYRFNLTDTEIKEICKIIEEKKQKRLVDAVRELPQGSALELRFNHE